MTAPSQTILYPLRFEPWRWWVAAQRRWLRILSKPVGHRSSV